MTRGVARAAFGLAITTVGAATAHGQTVDVERPRTLVVGQPPGGSREDRVDAARTGRARTPLPSSGLHTPWRTTLGMRVEHCPLVDAAGRIYVVGDRGEVVSLSAEGEERWRVATASVPAGPAVLLSDDTIAFVDTAGEALAVRDGALRWRSKVGRPSPSGPAPLALDDGGVVVATAGDATVLDGDGRTRARTTLREGSIVTVVSAIGKVVLVGATGTVWTWEPGAPEAIRIARFGSPIDGGAALSDDHTLVAVSVGAAHLVAVDLTGGTTTLRAASSDDVWLGPPAMQGPTAWVVALTRGSEFLLALDATGVEILRLPMTSHGFASPDGGGATPRFLGRSPPLVDAAGQVAFATMDGSVGVAGVTVGSRSGGTAAVILLAAVCPAEPGGAPRIDPPIAALAPLGPDAFVAVCRSGRLLCVAGTSNNNR
jgi:hypothetical protein